ncbi:N-acetylmuramoyl-L-alanine amidase family protein [Alkalihalobacillus deserti]|uniref:N-acetylmuramoyl-L-alanine amidase family protein n=1 Tax=Alkalihalobacillus deserti TaxID=2879466 RepID=UPI0027E1BD04|nr:N-acetylmuramoyl-L-alanine amidase [Alkalihalobacillus deserti]
MHEEITRVNNLAKRGKMQANFHVLRETSMSALLIENFFIKSAAKLSDPNWRQTVAEASAERIVVEKV